MPKSPFILPGLLFSIAGGLLLIWHLRFRKYAGLEPACARCGYLVVGLSGDICPECGGCLSEVGIRSPGAFRPMPRAIPAMIFLLLYMPCVLLAHPVLVQLLPRWYSGKNEVHMAGAPSHAYSRVAIVAADSGWSPEIRFYRVDLTMTLRNGETRALHVPFIEGASMPPRVKRDESDEYLAVKDVTDLTPELIADWMKWAAQTDSPAARDEAASIFAETINVAWNDEALRRRAPLHTPFGVLSFRQRNVARFVRDGVWVTLDVAMALAGFVIACVIYRRSGMRKREVAHA